jgi:hypothetical protein
MNLFTCTLQMISNENIMDVNYIPKLIEAHTCFEVPEHGAIARVMGTKKQGRIEFPTFFPS